MPELSLAPFYQIDPPSDSLFAHLEAVEASLAELSAECTQLAAHAQTIQKKLDAGLALLTSIYEEVNDIYLQAETLASTAQAYLVSRVETPDLLHQIAATREVLQGAGRQPVADLPPHEENLP